MFCLENCKKFVIKVWENLRLLQKSVSYNFSVLHEAKRKIQTLLPHLINIKMSKKYLCNPVLCNVGEVKI